MNELEEFLQKFSKDSAAGFSPEDEAMLGNLIESAYNYGLDTDPKMGADMLLDITKHLEKSDPLYLHVCYSLATRLFRLSGHLTKAGKPCQLLFQEATRTTGPPSANLIPVVLATSYLSKLPIDTQEVLKWVWGGALQTMAQREVIYDVMDYLSISAGTYPTNAILGQTIWRMRNLRDPRFLTAEAKLWENAAFWLLFTMASHFDGADAPLGKDLEFESEVVESHEVAGTVGQLNLTLGQVRDIYKNRVLNGTGDSGQYPENSILVQCFVQREQELSAFLKVVDTQAWERVPNFFNSGVPRGDLPLAAGNRIQAWPYNPPTSQEEGRQLNFQIAPAEVVDAFTWPEKTQLDEDGLLVFPVGKVSPITFRPATTDPGVWPQINKLHQALSDESSPNEDLLDLSALTLLRIPKENPTAGDLLAYLHIIELWPALGSAAAAYQEMLKFSSALPLIEIEPYWQGQIMLKQAFVWLAIDDYERACQAADQAMSLPSPNPELIRFYGTSIQMHSSAMAGYQEETQRLADQNFNLAWGCQEPWMRYFSAFDLLQSRPLDEFAGVMGMVGALNLYQYGSLPHIRNYQMLLSVLTLANYLSEVSPASATYFWESAYHYIDPESEEQRASVIDSLTLCYRDAEMWPELQHLAEECAEEAYARRNFKNFVRYFHEYISSLLLGDDLIPFTEASQNRLQGILAVATRRIVELSSAEVAGPFMAQNQMLIGRQLVTKQEPACRLYLQQALDYFARENSAKDAAYAAFYLAKSYAKTVIEGALEFQFEFAPQDREPARKWASVAREWAEKAPDIEADFKEVVVNLYELLQAL